MWNLGNILTEFTGTGTEQGFLLSLLGMDTPIERTPVAGGTHETLLTDMLSTALAAYDDVPSVIRSTEFYAFGAVRSGADPGPIGFAGARKLGGTGLYYLRNRVYDPQLARFLARDPLEDEGGANRYAYGLNAPPRWSDPEGLKVRVNDGRVKTAARLIRQHPGLSHALDQLNESRALIVYIDIKPGSTEENPRAAASTGNFIRSPPRYYFFWQDEAARRAYMEALAEPGDKHPPVYVQVSLYADRRTKLPHIRGDCTLTEAQWIAARLVHELWHVVHFDRSNEYAPDRLQQQFLDYMRWPY